ncbi:MAG: NADH-quinone oxidoreductase subunit K [Candidatus Competibacteraceae bacterium]|nr:NADH-quinone oxidoreductase subunit K [Candidatus Competibacteraceae bacterium]
MIGVLALVVAFVVAAGVYLMLSRDVFRCIVGLAMLGGAANVVLFAAGRFGPLQPPIVAAGADRLAAATADPLPQALVLTAIVIGFALLGFALALGARLRAQGASDDSDRLRDAEPPAGDPIKPPVLD